MSIEDRMEISWDLTEIYSQEERNLLNVGICNKRHTSRRNRVKRHHIGYDRNWNADCKQVWPDG